jgi:hypothetical protein
MDIKDRSNEIVDILTFIESLDIKLFPTQKFVLKCAYGMNLDDAEKVIKVPNFLSTKTLYEFTEKEFLSWLYDRKRCNTKEVEGKTFHNLIWVMGRRATKSTLSSLIELYEVYKLIMRGNPLSYYGISNNDEINLINIAPTIYQAENLFEIVSKKIKNCEILCPRIQHDTKRYMNLKTDYDLLKKLKTNNKESTIHITTGSSNCKDIKNKNYMFVSFDEAAFFLDKKNKPQGYDLCKSIFSSTNNFKKDGKVLVFSSPFNKSGLFYNLYKDSFKDTENTLMLKMYTSLMNPTMALNGNFLITELKRDKLGFKSEFAAIFTNRKDLGSL